MTKKPMRILMMTNTYAPVIGGIEASIHSFCEQFRKMGHKVVIVAPTFDGMKENEEDIVRLPAIQNFLKEDVSLNLPIPLFLSNFTKKFQPDIVHSHHFFWVGDVALRLARQQHIPLVFTHHIMLEQYAELFPIHNEGITRFVLKLATGYANLTDCVIAPSEAVRAILERDGVRKPMHIIPTGVDVKRFAKGDAREFRRSWKIPQDAFVLGFVGRLNPEKNLDFLAKAACRFIKKNRKAHWLMVGEGSLKEAIQDLFKSSGVGERLHCPGVLQGQDLINGYHAMDVFIFSSFSETQGIVLSESMAAGKPVVAVNAPVVRDVIKDGKNGRLVAHEDEEEFAQALSWVAKLSEAKLKKIKQAAIATAAQFSIEHCSEQLLDVYQNLKLNNKAGEKNGRLWKSVKDSLKVEKDLLLNAIHATEAALRKNKR